MIKGQYGLEPRLWPCKWREKRDSNRGLGSTDYYSEEWQLDQKKSHLSCLSVQTVFQDNQIILNDVRKLFLQNELQPTHIYGRNDRIRNYVVQPLMK